MTDFLDKETQPLAPEQSRVERFVRFAYGCGIRFCDTVGGEYRAVPLSGALDLVEAFGRTDHHSMDDFMRWAAETLKTSDVTNS